MHLRYALIACACLLTTTSPKFFVAGEEGGNFFPPNPAITQAANPAPPPTSQPATTPTSPLTTQPTTTATVTTAVVTGESPSTAVTNSPVQGNNPLGPENNSPATGNILPDQGTKPPAQGNNSPQQHSATVSVNPTGSNSNGNGSIGIDPGANYPDNPETDQNGPANTSPGSQRTEDDTATLAYVNNTRESIPNVEASMSLIIPLLLFLFAVLFAMACFGAFWYYRRSLAAGKDMEKGILAPFAPINKFFTGTFVEKLYEATTQRTRKDTSTLKPMHSQTPLVVCSIHNAKGVRLNDVGNKESQGSCNTTWDVDMSATQSPRSCVSERTVNDSINNSSSSQDPDPDTAVCLSSTSVTGEISAQGVTEALTVKEDQLSTSLSATESEYSVTYPTFQTGRLSGSAVQLPLHSFDLEQSLYELDGQKKASTENTNGEAEYTTFDEGKALSRYLVACPDTTVEPTAYGCFEGNNGDKSNADTTRKSNSPCPSPTLSTATLPPSKKQEFPSDVPLDTDDLEENVIYDADEQDPVSAKSPPLENRQLTEPVLQDCDNLYAEPDAIVAHGKRCPQNEYVTM